MTPYQPLSYSDYQRLRLAKLEDIFTEDLHKFLLEDFLHIYSIRSVGGVDARQEYVATQKNLVQKYHPYKPLFFLLDTLFLTFIKHQGKKKKILFQNAKYPSIILEAKKHYQVGLMVQGVQDRLFALKHGLAYISINDLEQLALTYAQSGSDRDLSDLILTAQKKLTEAGPDYIVFRDDALTVGRALALASRSLGIKTLAVQQGLYDKYYMLFNDLAVDYVLVWGQFVKDLFVSQQAREAKDIYILGHSQKQLVLKAVAKKPYTLCYLAQDWERYDSRHLATKLETVKNLALMCQKLGLQFLYRPHPWENRVANQAQLPRVTFTLPKETLVQTLKRTDILVSFSSTALIEASMMGKVTLQLANFPIKLDNFEQLGVCSKTFESLNQLQIYLTQLATSSNLEQFKPVFNNEYIETRNDPGKRFVGILQDIERNGQEKNSNHPS